MSREIKWLHRQITGWVSRGIIDEAAAERIRAEYSGQVQGKRSWMPIFALIGTLLIGLGVILILAHNWQELTRMSRLVVTVALLLGGQIGAGFALWYRGESLVWKEGAGILLALLFGAAVAMVGQTYHVTDDTGGFLLTWLLLSLPIVYLLQSTLTAMFYLVTLLAWAGVGHVPLFGNQPAWALLAGVVPYAVSVMRDEGRRNQAAFLAVSVAIAVYILVAETWGEHLRDLLPLVYMPIFTLTYLIGMLDKGQARLWSRALVRLGVLGAVGMAFIYSFRGAWEIWRYKNMVSSNGAMIATLILIVALVLTGWILYKRLSREWLLMMFTPILFIAWLGGVITMNELISAITMNVFVFIFGLYVIARGISGRSLVMLNLGMLLIGTLIMARFLDSHFSLFLRGLVFIGLGVTFLAVNRVMVRRKAGREND